MTKPDDFTARPVTTGPMHHFFGYYGISPWDNSGRLLLSMEVPFDNHPPVEGDRATVGVVDSRNLEFTRLVETNAWNFQQGAMMHWLPNTSDPQIIFNDRVKRNAVSIILNLRSKEARTIARPVSALSHNGKTALSLNFGRLQWVRSDYGYAGVQDPYFNEPCPGRDGVFSVDLERNEAEQAVSLEDVLGVYDKPEEMQRSPIAFNHTTYSPDDRRFAFLIQWTKYLFPKQVRVSKLKKVWKLKSIMFTANVDGSGLRQMTEFEDVSHYDWKDPEHILMWAKAGGSKAFFLATDGRRDYKRIAESTLTEDGHCSYSPNGRWVLVDTYPTAHYRTLKILNWERQEEHILGRYYSPPRYSNQVRCDLHPRWNRTGTHICFDSAHQGSRQMYKMDVSELTCRDCENSDVP